VYYMGRTPCWGLRVARSPEEALMSCLNQTGKPKPPDAEKNSCRVEEVQIKGYRIRIEQESKNERVPR